MDTKELQEVYESTHPQWYIFRNCNQFGPLTSKEICDLLKSNQITNDHHIRHANVSDWTTIKDIEVFQNVGFGISFPKGQQAFIENHHDDEGAGLQKRVEQKPASAHKRSSESSGLWNKIKGLFRK